jgi:uncharacterized protein YjiS (DUF1127 family)
MSGYVAKEEIALLMPERLSHYFQDDRDHMPASTTNGRTMFEILATAVKWLVEIPRRRAMLDELGSLTDHELADIGLSRAELGQVFDRDLSMVRNAERGLMASGRPHAM